MCRPGDCLVYTRAPWREPTAPSHFDVLLEDDQVVSPAAARRRTLHLVGCVNTALFVRLALPNQLAVAKPAGLQVLPKGDFCQRTLMWLLQQYHQQHRSRRYPDSLVPVPVHRLGRGTSGGWREQAAVRMPPAPSDVQAQSTTCGTGHLRYEGC